MKKHHHYLDKTKTQLFKNEVLIANKVVQRNCTLKVLEDLLFSDELEDIFLCHQEKEGINELEKLSINVVKNEWNQTYKMNISLENGVCLDDFPNGYCFFTELWESSDNCPILVLFQYH